MTARPRFTRNTSFVWISLVGSETTAQFALKQAAMVTDIGTGLSDWLAAVVTNPWFLLSICCDITGFSAWIAILRQHDLSLAVPLSSLSYITTIVMAFILFREPVTQYQIVGMVCIGLGILLLAPSNDPG